MMETQQTLLFIQEATGADSVAALRLEYNGGASTVKEPGHIEVRKSSSQVTRMHSFPQKKLTTFF